LVDIVQARASIGGDVALAVEAGTGGAHARALSHPECNARLNVGGQVREVAGRGLKAQARARIENVVVWPTEDDASPDFEVLHVLRPGMATIPGATVVCASSPYAQRGACLRPMINAIEDRGPCKKQAFSTASTTSRPPNQVPSV
jgi:hypothetical protein